MINFIKSSWLISLFFSASDILLSMLFNLVLSKITILLTFCFLFLVVVFFTIPVEFENSRVKLALIIFTGTPITVANDVAERLSLVADKTIKDL